MQGSALIPEVGHRCRRSVRSSHEPVADTVRLQPAISPQGEGKAHHRPGVDGECRIAESESLHQLVAVACPGPGWTKVWCCCHYVHPSASALTRQRFTTRHEYAQNVNTRRHTSDLEPTGQHRYFDPSFPRVCRPAYSGHTRQPDRTTGRRRCRPVQRRMASREQDGAVTRITLGPNLPGFVITSPSNTYGQPIAQAHRRQLGLVNQLPACRRHRRWTRCW